MDGDEPKIFSLNSLNYLKLMKVWTVYLTAHHHLSTVALNVIGSTPLKKEERSNLICGPIQEL